MQPKETLGVKWGAHLNTGLFYSQQASSERISKYIINKINKTHT